jgi:hypothetical protein
MAKAGRRKRSKARQMEKVKEDLEYDDDDVDEEPEVRERKRSQAAVKQKMSQKKQDKVILVIAAILIIFTISGYFYFDNFLTPDDGSSEGADDNFFGNYTASIHVISDTTHKYDDTSWHLVTPDGFTNFILRVSNSGTKEDTFKLSITNLDSRFKVIFNKNNFKVKPGKFSVVIAEVTTSISYEYRLPTPIKINLISDFAKSVIDTVEIDLTVKQLKTDEEISVGDKVAAFYSGVFEVNGSLFDYSLKNPESSDPLYISLSDEIQYDTFESRQYVTVIPGFKKGIIGMLPGETHSIVVPPELGYPKDYDLGGKTLIFEVKLLSNDRNV